MMMASAKPERFESTANSIHRSQERFLVHRWQIRRLTMTGFVLVALCLSMLAVPALAQDQQKALGHAVDWLMTQQQADGGFAGFSGESDPGATADAVLALVAADYAGVQTNIGAAMNYLAEHALVFTQQTPGAAAKFALVLIATGNNPHDFENVNPLAIVERAAEQGTIGQGPFEHALGLLALVAAGDPVPDAAIDSARTSQTEDGAWAFDGTTDAGAGDTNTTAMMVQALVAAGAGDEMIAPAMAYLLSASNDDGGFGYVPGAEPDANSTSLVLQALYAVNDEANVTTQTAAEVALLEMQNESGAFHYMTSMPDDNAFATVQAIPAVAQVAFPIPAVMSVLATPEATPAA